MYLFINVLKTYDKEHPYNDGAFHHKESELTSQDSP